MKNLRKNLNLIALTVFMGSNLLTPISYAVDDLEFEVETPQLKSDSIIQVVPSISEGGGESLTNLENKAEGGNSSLDAPDEVQKDNTQEGDTQEDIEKTVEEYSTDEQAKTSTDNTVLDYSFQTVGEEGDILTSSSFSGGKDNLEQTAKEGESLSVVSDNNGDDTDEEEGDEDEDPLPEDERKKELEKARETLEGPITESETFDELGMVVKVKALSGTFPKGTYPEITLIQGTEKEKVEQQIIDSENANVSADAEMITFDIKFIYTLSNGSGVEVQPKDNTVQVTFEYKENEELQQAEEDIQIIHINDKDENGEKVAEGTEKVETIDINEQKSAKVENGLVIDAESFSYYTIVVQRREEAPESAPTQTWQYGEDRDYLTISIARPSSFSSSDYPIEGFTIMDRNLGASISGTTCNTTNATGACGYLYQWGNNYGFPISANANSILTEVGLTWDDSYNNNGYVSKKFVNGESFNYDVWSGGAHHDGIWGGANDVNFSGTKNDINGLYWDDGGDRTLRQGPCPEGWHVPSAGEWSMLLYYWYYTNYFSHPSVSSNLYYFSDLTKRQAFMDYFYIPSAGRRNYSNASLGRQGSNGPYWSSSPDGSLYPESARYLNLYSSNVSADNGISRASGLSVRCFKDSYVASPESSNLVDTQAWVEGKDFETITISNPEDSSEGFTIMDRNLGAENAGTDSSAYGFKYQWGNNYGFVDGCSTNGCSDSVTSSSVAVSATAGATWNEIYNNHGYFGNTFIKSSSSSWGYDYWADNTRHNNLRGGESDAGGNNRGANQTNPTERQGPCPVGYHVPSMGEWGLLIKYWADTKGDGVNKNATYSDSSEGLYNLTSNYDKFQQKFNLPFAGYRNDSNASLNLQGSYGLYWSSSPSSAGSNYARNLSLSSSSVLADNANDRADGFSVRCFKDSYVAPKTYTLTFDSQGGTAVSGQTVVEGQTRSRPADPTKTNYTFGGWYTSTGYTSVFDFSTPASANTTVYAKWNDAVAPANVTISTTSNEKATSQTATLSCTDEIGVTKYYWGTSSSPADSVYTTVTSTTSFSTTQSVSSAVTYYLFCKDAAGNTSTSATKTYYTYSVQNMLDKVSGTQGTYNTTNYETNGSSMGTYIIPSGTSITLNNSTSYGDPISSHDTYAGYTTANSGTPTNSNPTISANTTYYRWFNRDSHTLTLNKGTGISSVSGAGTYKHGSSVSIDATVTNGYTWVNWAKTAGNDPTSATTKSTTVTITSDTTLTANAGDQTDPVCSISTQPTRTLMSLVNDYNQGTVTFTCTDEVGVATSNLSADNITHDSNVVTLSNFTVGGTSTSKTFTFTYTSNAQGSTTFTLKAGAVSDAANNSNAATSATESVTVDTTAPTITITQPNSSDWTKSKSVTASASDGTLTMKESTSSTCNSSVQDFVTYADKNYTSESDNGKYICYKAVDSVGNEAYESSAKVEKIDRTAPVLSGKTTFLSIWYTANQTSTFTYTDTGAGINEGYNTAECTISNEGIDSTCQITPNICDKVGNCNTTTQTSNSIKLDKTAPVFKEKTTYNDIWYNSDQTSTFTYEDTISGINGDSTTSCTINEEGTTATCTVENTNICNNAGLCNITNQTSNSIKLDKTNPTCSITGNPTSPTNQNVELTLNYLVEANQISDGYSWDGESYSTTQKLTVTQNGTYTGYVKDAAGNTGKCIVTVSMIDKVAPTITINNPDTTPAQSKTITATTDKGTLYMAITGANICDDSLDFVAYESIIFSSESDNEKYVCYKAEDEAGNVKYEISIQIEGIKEPSKGGNYSGGGGRRTPVKSDTHGSAETGDKIDNVVDVDTGDIVGENKSAEENSQDKNDTQTSFTQEQIDAYTWANENGITTKPTIESAKLNTDITREQLAKMMVVYMSKVLGKQPVINKTAKYRDVSEKSRGKEMYDYIQLAYQYQIMGINYKGEPIRYFNPSGKVTRAEFATVLSRVLYGSKYNQKGVKYYEKHMKALNEAGILTNTNPELIEKRGYVMLMLMRSAK